MMRRVFTGVARTFSSRPASSPELTVEAARTFSSRSASTPELTVEADCSWRKIGAQTTVHGRTCMAVVGEDALGQAERCVFEIRKVGINCVVFTARGAYPTAESIDEARILAKRIGAGSIVGIGGGGAIDTAKGVSRLYTSSGECKHFLSSPGSILMGEGSKSEPQKPVGNALPLVMVPTSAGAGAGANGRCLVWHPADEVLVPMTQAPRGGERGVSVALMDPTLCASLSKVQTVAMALTALSACVDALLVWELAATAGTPLKDGGMLQQLAVRGISAVAEGLPVALESSKNVLARELLLTSSVCAGQLSVITPAPPTQLLSRAAGSLLCRQSYPSLCAMLFPHVVGDMLNQANSFSGDSDMAEAIERALSRSASALLGDGKEAQALLAWLDIQERDWLDSSSLSALDPTITAKDVVGNVEMLLALEEDTAAADRIWSGNGVLDVAELAVG